MIVPSRLTACALGAALPLTSGLVAAARGAETPAAGAPSAGGPAKAVDFARDIRPLFAARCVACHGAKVQKSGLRLDSKAHALQGGDSGPAIVPGKSAEGELIHRITTTDPKLQMPPGGKPLAPAQVALLRAWIEQGAPWPEEAAPEVVRSTHWAFQPVKRIAPPAVKLQGWSRNPIDQFVLAKLEAKGLKPSPLADRVTLLRRVTLDLTGLLPTPEEVDAFLRDTAPGAYERVVDRLLASPHYGEKWGRHWLDAARYADSNGHTIDSARSIWKYRDWVIEAFNRDMPFDQFTVEQLAGDLLPNATQSQIVATGFHRNTMINEEGGVDKEQFRNEAVVDRVNTTGTVWLGLTIGCAQCHTHKYDPVTQAEYYKLFAFFNNQDEPTLSLPSPEQAARQTELSGRIAAARKALARLDAEAGTKLAALEEKARTSASRWRVLERAEARAASGSVLRKLPDGSFLVTAPAGGEVPDNDTFTVTAELPEGPVTAVRLEALTHESLPGGGPGWARGNFLLTDFSVAAAAGSGSPEAVPVSAALADHSQANYPVSNAVDRDPKTGWAINVAAGQGKLNTDRTAVFLLANPVNGTGGTRLTITLKQQHPNRQYLLGRFRLAVTGAPVSESSVVLPAVVRAALAVPAESRTKEQKDLLTAELRNADPERAKLAAEIASLQAEEKELARAIPSTLVLKELAAPRETFVHIRGDFLRHGPKVAPGVPAVLPPLPKVASAPTRLDLARWLVDPKNPLTGRVTVNRVWQTYFGTGLVETENDFGTQGTPPTHPELLDWLASEFMSGRAGERGNGSGRVQTISHSSTPPVPHSATANGAWSLKRLHRLIVTSATYMQASKDRPELREVDPQNRLLARQNRNRLEAELIRDVSLSASGLLSRKIGGPSVFPPQPGGLDLFTQSKKNWTPSQGEDRYRRGMYTFAWRSSPYAMFTTFDAPNGTTTCTRRTRSNTPLGSLMLANDAGMFEMAQALAVRIVRDESGEDQARVRYAFRRCLSREPAPAEQSRLLAYYRSQLEHFRTAPTDAERVAPRDRPESIDAAQAAAWTSVARVLMNLDEFITRE